MAKPAKITVTKRIEETLRLLAEQDGSEGRLEGDKFVNAARGVARQLIARIDDARTKTETFKGMNPYDFVRYVRAGCPTVMVPPSLTPPLMGMIKTKVNLLGLTPDLIELAATRAKHQLHQPMALSYFLKVIDGFVGDVPEKAVTSGDEIDWVVSDGRG